ncbi:hypothetical protein [Candidatus Nanohalobium constans]|uniref:Uncharacterized protein n=1 Tax=Candidatus Nanohalobium constans TaxID=2565781 RepID=A0A5Q0UFY7_9ARCH|nr:hypothetical protein [Candidatus Nanohalobium constans]QGA80120.1 hypothetical protein LC1Nh_0216 [Candidatus Nanohalobium constans]
MTSLDNLSIGKISELTTSDSEYFREEVKSIDLTVQDLKALKEAELSGKNREELINFLDDQLNAENVGNYLNLAERDMGQVENLISEIERVEDIEHLDEEKIEIDQDNLIDLIGGTVDEMKEFVKENPLTSEQLENVLDAEERIKDRKTAKQFLKRQIKKREVGEDVKKARKDVESLENDLEEIRKDETDVSKTEDDKEDDRDDENSEVSVEESEEDKETGNRSQDEDREESEDSLEQENEGEKNGEENSEPEEEPRNESGEDSKPGDENKDEDEDSKFERKKRISEDLELDMSDEELEDFSLEQLEEIKSEKEHRESLIERLEENGMDEEDLREASTSDLEKLANSLESKDESQEEHEEMREEAEEDLEMLMGAVRGEEESSEEKEGESAKEKLEDLKENLRDKLKHSSNEEESSSKGLSVEKLEEILDEYRELGDEEASVKTAHIMKGFLEQKLGIERELTYKELAGEMPTDEGEEIEKLAEFFVKMHREQYTGRLQVNNPEEIIDTCIAVAESLS